MSAKAGSANLITGTRILCSIALLFCQTFSSPFFALYSNYSVLYSLRPASRATSLWEGGFWSVSPIGSIPKGGHWSASPIGSLPEGA